MKLQNTGKFVSFRAEFRNSEFCSVEAAKHWQVCEFARLMSIRECEFLLRMSMRDCFMDYPWYPSKNVQMDTSGPIPSTCVPDNALWNSVWLKLTLVFLQVRGSTPTKIPLAISITRAKQECEFPRCTHCCAFCAPPSVWGLGERKCSVDASSPFPSSGAPDILVRFLVFSQVHS